MANKPQDYNNLRAKIIARAWKDPQFKQKLLKNPKAALKEMGWDFPENLDLRVIEDKPNSFTFVLPQAVANMAQMSDAELERWAGGGVRSVNAACYPTVYPVDPKCPH